MPKIVDHDKYREELLGGCFELFSDKGYSNVTMRQIAKRLGISTGALYHYFPTKQSILDQMFQYMGKKDVEEVTQAPSLSGTFEERISRFLEFFQVKESAFGKMLLLSIDFVRCHDTAQARQTARQWLDYYIRNMAVYLGLPSQVAEFTATFLGGLVYQNRLVPGSVSLPDQLALLKDVLMVYLGEHENPENRLCKLCPFMTDHHLIDAEEVS
ncbi:TetR/AcrR family transcriptional regulator [Desulfatibacillum aliphaticivorans]|uniref:Transcriptional regulator, TetR family n=1 Tax=Desulfatibacillum aliphaticivorans TaxID=218208 RepID=B8FDD7_DESAL|nr:TetR/AcrR family transcriptional regulator [Desulfatibacillum aliphaticivorans]ACL06568.1 transcriptional regulator, TetR family [Desulfatibacillum aliphaticivorans]